MYTEIFCAALLHPNSSLRPSYVLRLTRYFRWRRGLSARRPLLALNAAEGCAGGGGGGNGKGVGWGGRERSGERLWPGPTSQPQPQPRVPAGNQGGQQPVRSVLNGRLHGGPMLPLFSCASCAPRQLDGSPERPPITRHRGKISIRLPASGEKKIKKKQNPKEKK